MSKKIAFSAFCSENRVVDNVEGRGSDIINTWCVRFCRQTVLPGKTHIRAISFISLSTSSPSCINEYLAINNDGIPVINYKN